ncbi:MAG: NAD(+)/NADH kinase, partial [Thermoplasmata archaeon]|nr:NAD(+)/NADH kinase [Thermoplasmata archaeon]
MFTLGFLVNPIAGMGGTVGLKGTDGGLWREAVRRGAVPVAPRRAVEFLRGLKVLDLEVVTLPGRMGEEECAEAKIGCRVVDMPLGEETSGDDTARGAGILADEGVDLLSFVGGDGTARDVVRGVGRRLPVLGVPAGVKMFSGVFSPNPLEAAGAVEEYMETGTSVETEILDIDEDAYRGGEVKARLYDVALTPSSPHVVIVGKSVFRLEDESESLEGMGEFIRDEYGGGKIVLGPGSTVRAVGRALGVEPSPLGFDVYVGEE